MPLNIDDIEIIDVHTHSFLNIAGCCIGAYGKLSDMEEFVRD